jgi:ribosomal protein S18 acetylase RimI-like enzyme
MNSSLLILNGRKGDGKIMDIDKAIIYKEYDKYEEQWLDMCVTCYMEVYEQGEQCKYEEVRYNLESVVNCNNSIGVVAVKNKKCVGFVIGNMYYINGDVYSDIDEICVIESERRQSVGSELLRAFETLSKKHGSYCICLEHFATDELNRFYEKNSYFIPDDRVVRNKMI